MLADQNRKLDLQNHLSVVASEIAEAQRNSQFAELIPPIIEEVRQVKINAQSRDAIRGQVPASDSGFDNLAIRIAVLTQRFQPYRWVDTLIDGNALLIPKGDGLMFATVQRIRSVFDAAFGSSAMEPGRKGHIELQLPILTANRYSPERGLILVNLHALRFDIRPLSAYNATFERIYAPGARFNEIQLGGLPGPDLSKPATLAHSFLPRATFNRANLSGVDFTGANLQGAELSATFLAGTNWTETDLSNARLISANLEGVTLERTQLMNADLSGANLASANLSSVRGLTKKQVTETCIDTATTKLPAGLLPNGYVVPLDCCKTWTAEGNSFMLDDQGRCKPPSTRSIPTKV